VAKDRARPFSRKHRKYWFTVTGGYEPPRTPERIIPVLPPAGSPAGYTTDGSISLGDIPVPVMRAFAVAYPRHIPAPKRLVVGSEAHYDLTFTDAGKTTTVSYKPDGTFLGAR
jgi:hypothetical protein